MNITLNDDDGTLYVDGVLVDVIRYDGGIRAVRYLIDALERDRKVAEIVASAADEFFYRCRSIADLYPETEKPTTDAEVMGVMDAPDPLKPPPWSENYEDDQDVDINVVITDAEVMGVMDAPDELVTP